MSDLPINYLRYSALQQTKQVSLVMSIDGFGQLFANRATYGTARYGDPGLAYGMTGLVYGGKVLRSDSRAYMDVTRSSLNLDQRLEPEQGRASVSTITIALIDKGGYVTRVLSPGGGLMANVIGVGVTLFLGYQELSYPEDYFTVFRGFITAISYVGGGWQIQLSDANAKRRQNLFFCGRSVLQSDINNAVTTIPVIDSSQFPVAILGPDGTYDTGVKTFLRIDSEWILYDTAHVAPTSITAVTRNAQVGNETPPGAAAHTSGTEVDTWIQFQGHAVDLALKLMLSGWNGPWATNVPVFAFVFTFGFGNFTQGILLPVGVDAQRDYGLVVGDYVTVSGATNVGNNGTFVISDFLSPSETQPNQMLFLATDASLTTPAVFTAESPTSAVLAFRSQYDTLPLTCGMRLTPREVDVSGHLTLKQLYLADSGNRMRFLLTTAESGKSFIENELYLPLGLYSLTRRGRMSVSLTKPPLASQNVIVLDRTNVLEPQTTQVTRATNNRTMFNDIDVEYDYDSDGNFKSVFHYVDSDSLTAIGIPSTLPIQSRGVRSDLSTGINTLLTRRALFLLSRYRLGAVMLTCKVNWGTGSQIEAGDAVIFDGTGMELPNFDDGSRNLGPKLYEVVGRPVDLKNGNVALTLISGVGAESTDRFGVISPSSVIASVVSQGGGLASVLITASFSAANPAFPGNEPKKWKNFVGLRLAVHSEDFTTYGELTFVGFAPGNPSQLNFSGVGITLAANQIIEVPRYPTGTTKNVNPLYKQLYAYQNVQLTVVAGISTTQFTVSAGDAAKCPAGTFVVRVHSATFGIDSLDLNATISGTTITTVKPMGFSPSAGQLADLIGYQDGGGPYRII